jgi:mono/diheme cytochrome c family protein
VRAALLVSAAGIAATLVLGGCGSGGFVEGGSQGAGKQLFVQRCAACHALADAGTAGTIGPDLDDAFAQSRRDGMTSATFAQVVAGQIRFPIEETATGAPGMPGPDTTLPRCEDVEGDAFCVEDQDQAIADIAAYVGAVAGTGVEPAPGPGEAADESRPARDAVVEIVTEGRGAMPPFEDSPSPAQIRAVAEYVSRAAGS